MRPELRTLPVGAIIPAYQASATLAGVLDGLLRSLPAERIIVVDDGSTDGTLALATGKGVISLSHPFNRGKGSALMTGLREARRHGWEWAITLDSDGQHTMQDFEKILSARPEPITGIVVGSRLRIGTSMPWHRRFSNMVSTWIVSKLAGKPVFDAQSGFRAYRTDILESLPGEGRFEWEAQAMVLCCRKGYGLERIPIQTVYGAQGSHIRLIRDTWRFLRMAGRLAWTR